MINKQTVGRLGRNALRRLVTAFIQHEQSKLLSKGLIGNGQTLAGQIAGKSNAGIDEVEITEEGLGFDSLSMLDLILAINQLFELHRSGVEDYLLLKRRIGDWIDLLEQHGKLVDGPIRFQFQTSGSTGAPHVVQHPAETLWSEMHAQSAGPLSNIAAPGRIISLVPPNHIYGFLFTCILPDLLGMEVIDLTSAGPSASFRNARSGDLIVGTPFNWDLLAKSGLQFQDGVRGIVSAGPSTAQTWSVVAGQNLKDLTEIFGSTETAGIGTRSNPDAPFELLPNLEHSNGDILRRSSGEKLAVQDRLQWVDNTHFHVLGRLDHVVQVAGVNVSPALVREHILRVEGIADAAVRMGVDRLRAFVVPQPGIEEADLQVRLQEHLRKSLDAPARPGSVTFGDMLPRNQMGKAVDWTS